MTRDDMIPRITVRDDDDAVLIVTALHAYMNARLAAYERAARMPGADQIALSVQAIEATRNVCSLIESIRLNIVTTTQGE